MKGYMNSNFINRNRIYRMNKNAIMNENVIINNDLLGLPEGLASAEEINFDIERSLRPFAIGVMTAMENDKRIYYAYENDIHSENLWIEKFYAFKYAVTFAREIYNYRVAERNIVYKYEEDTRIHRK